MAFHAEKLLGSSLIKSLNLAEISKSYFISGRSTNLDLPFESKLKHNCVIVYLLPNSVVERNIVTKAGQVIVAFD